MVYHILRFAFRDGVPEDEQAEAIRQITSLEKLSSVTSAKVLQDLGNPAPGFTHSAVLIFDGEAEYKDYLLDPYHSEVVEYAISRVSKMMFCDAAEGFDPGRYARIRETAAAMPMSPELAAHVSKVVVA